jgi:predicted nucleic acid-binding protein
MIVIADTTPLNYLILIDLPHILHELFGQVVIPRTVLTEMESPLAPDKIRQWVAQRPDWLVEKDIQREDPTLAHLDPGERDAITLAQELQADLILLDERLGRQEATTRKFNVTGTVGILDRAGTRGLIDIAAAVSQLRQLNFRVSPRLLNSLLDRHKLSGHF